MVGSVCAGQTVPPPPPPGQPQPPSTGTQPPTNPLNGAVYVRDVTFPDDSAIAPGQLLVKKWRMKNTGTTTWGSGYQLVFRSGTRLGAPESVNIPAAAPGQVVNISVPLQIPNDIGPGTYRGDWQLRNPQGTYFGDPVWFILSVPGNQPPTGNATNGDVSVVSPSTVTPGQAFLPEVTVRVTSGQLRQDRGDMLRFYNGVNYSDFPHIAVQGIVGSGQSYTFHFSADHPMVAPPSEGTYESHWRLWSNGGWVGPEVVIKFSVYQAASNRPPNTPKLTSPGNWAVYYSGQTPNLCAQQTGDPDGDQINQYYFEIYASAQLWNSNWVSSNCVPAQGLGDFGYQWHVKVRDARGAESGWSDTWHFNIYSTTFTVTDFHVDPASPSNTPIVTVYATIAGNGGHAWRRLSVNTASDGSTNGDWQELAGWLDSPTLVAPWETFHQVQGIHMLRLEIKHYEQDPQIMIVQQPYTVTRGVPSRPVLLNPPSAFWSSNRTITFRWQPALRANSYRLVVGTTPDPQQAPIVDVTVSATEYLKTFTQDYPQLYWKVYAINEIGQMDSASGWWFGIDQVPPTSAISTSRTPTLSYDTQFAISWDGSDNASGVQTYDVQVRILPDGQWSDWLTDYPYASAIFVGQPGRSYEFRPRAHDIAGNVEEYPSTADIRVQVDPAQRPPEPWWNASYAHKRNLVVTNRMSDTTLPASYPVQLHFDGSTTPTAADIFNASQATNGNDVRVVYNNQTELPRQVINFSPLVIDIWFPTQTDIPISGSSTNYELYYGNTQAPDPGFNPRNVFVPHADADTRLLLYFNEGSGTVANDLSGYSNTGSLQGAFSQPWPDGKLWTGLHFDGNSLVRVEDSDSLRLTNQIVVEAWVRPTVIDNHTRNIVAKISPTDGFAYRLYLTNGYPIFHIYGDINDWGVQGPTQLEANRWYHIAGVYDRNAIHLFINGVEVQSTAYNRPINPAHAWLAIGNSAYGNEPFIGDIDQVRIGGVAMTAFPYAHVSVNPTAGASEERSQQETFGSTDVALQRLQAVPNPGGGILVQATLINQGAYPTYNEFFIDLYGNRTPSGPGDTAGSVGFWVNAPIAPGATLTVTKVLTGTALPILASASPLAVEQTVNLTAQVDATGVVHDIDRSNNILAGPQVCIAASDGYEGDDTAGQAHSTAIGEIQYRNFDKAGDQDWVKFDAIGGKTYIIQTANLGAAADTYLSLYDTNGSALLATNDDDGNSLASRMEWTAPASGTYYVQVRHWNSSAQGCGTSYDLLINIQKTSLSVYLPVVLTN